MAGFGLRSRVKVVDYTFDGDFVQETKYL